MHTARQEREIEYHAAHAAELTPAAVDFGILESATPRPWNAYWEAMWRLRGDDQIQGKRALVVGCGTGKDAIILAKMGMDVDAFDLSPEMLDIARRSAELSGVDVRFTEAPAEAMPYDYHSFDVVFVRDILHHVDIHKTLIQLRRVVRPGALMIISEIYCHSAVRWLRKRLPGWLAPIAHRLSHGVKYETEDEEPLDQKDIRSMRGLIDLETERYFCVFAGRVAPQTERWAKFDQSLATKLTGGRALLIGRLLS